MATSGTNYTGKWTLSNGVLTLSPVSGSSGQFRTSASWNAVLGYYVTLTQEEMKTVTKIVFSGSISFWWKALLSDTYTKATSFAHFFTYSSVLEGFPNLTSIDVSGLDCSGATDFRFMFSNTSNNITEIIGLSSLNVSNGVDFTNMFSGVDVGSLDLSNFPMNGTALINNMISDLDYCIAVTLPSNFARTSTGDTTYPYNFGLAPATNANGITVRTDEDFFKLPSGQQGGLWTRDISGTATLVFRVTTVMRDGDTADIDYSYATSSATAEVYLKASSESSFPSTPSTTFTLTGTGNGTVTVTLPTDDSYDAWIVVTDGNETIYTYPSIDSNILLFKIKKDKTAEDGDGYSIPHYSSQVITSYNSGWTVYSSGAANEIRVQKFGRICVLSGIMKNTAAKTINTTEQTMFTLPEGFRPNKVCKALCQGSDTAVWVLTVNTGGTVTASRYRLHSTTYPSVASGSWFPFHIAYMVD